MDGFEIEIFARWLHVIGACVLLGTGAGIAFFALMAHRTKNVTAIAHTMSIVVIADMIFTATAAILQPITGIWLAALVGWPLTQGWILVSIGLYVFIGIFWLPVVWIQIKMRDLAHNALLLGTDLPSSYHLLFKIWFACGIPAFLAILVIFWLMLAQPDITF
ncbi:MAG: DUF2269 domain-containing protein [Lentilitoribacter sp.]